MNFSEFTKKETKDISQSKTSQEETLRKTYEEIKDLNNDQLSQKLYEEVRKQKEEGSFNYEILESSLETLKPFIKQENYLQLKELLKTLK